MNVEQVRNVLLIKQQGSRDPSDDGIWGETGCWGSFRNENFDAVLGIGGSTAYFSISDKVTWGAIGPHEIGHDEKGNCIWGFERFSNPGSKGPLVEEGWPLVARTMQAAGRRPVLHRLGTTIELDIQITELVRSFGRASASRRTTPKPGICRERDELIVRGNFTLKVKQ